MSDEPRVRSAIQKSNARRRNVRRNNKTANEGKGGIVRTLGLMGLW
jgi:hypothetical protein